MIAALLTGLLFWAQAGAAPAASDLYYLVFLRPSPASQPLSKDEGQRIRAAHFANVHKMTEEGILVAAGPFDDTPAVITGIFLFKTSSLERAQQIAALDPMVVALRISVDAHAWRGPSGIGAEYLRLHQQHPETTDSLQAHPLCLVYRTAGGQAGERPASTLAAHAQYIERLRGEGKLGAAGGTEGQEDLAGMVVFKPAIPVEEAHKLMQEDPAVKAGAIRIEFHQWLCASHVLPW